MTFDIRIVTVASLAAFLAVACGTPPPSVVADAIYSGGPIVTVNDAQPTAESLAVKNGKILALGSRAEIEQAHKSTATKMIDLGGRTLAPGFVDGHVHFLGLGAQAVGANLLAPPDGRVNTIDDLVAKLEEFAKGPDAERTGWIFGMGYDDALLGRHPNRDDLDRVSKDRPVMAVHISGHFSAVNSAGLRKIGYTTISEGRAFAPNHEDLVSFATRGLLDIDVASYIGYLDDYLDRSVITPEWFSRSYRNHYRIAGLKVTLDGSPQGRRAARHGGRSRT